MTDNLFLEQVAMPRQITLCIRCKRGIQIYLGEGDGSVYETSKLRQHPWCYTCGSKLEGLVYVPLLRDDSR